MVAPKVINIKLGLKFPIVFIGENKAFKFNKNFCKNGNKQIAIVIIAVHKGGFILYSI